MDPLLRRGEYQKVALDEPREQLSIASMNLSERPIELELSDVATRITGLERVTSKDTITSSRVHHVYHIFHHQPKSVRLQALLDNFYFQSFMALTIVANAAIIGAETDIPDFQYWFYVETLFLVVFTIELVIRILAVGIYRFLDFRHNVDFSWNVFDAIIVCVGIFDTLAEACMNHHGRRGGGVSTLFRIFRLLRILRIFKIVRFLKELYLLAYGFVEATYAIFWVTVLMGFVLYLCAVILVRTYGHLPENCPGRELMAQRFATIGVTMLSLFELMSDPGKLQDFKPILAEYPGFAVFLIAFVIYGSFGMIALLTGVISESMFEKNQMKQQEERLEREKQRKWLEKRCLEMFREGVEKDMEGEALAEDISELVPDIIEIFEESAIPYARQDLVDIVQIMDANDSGKISEEEFIQGILTLSDGVRPMSIHELFHITSNMRTKILKMEEELKCITGCTNNLPQFGKELHELTKLVKERLSTQDNAQAIEHSSCIDAHDPREERKEGARAESPHRCQLPKEPVQYDGHAREIKYDCSTADGLQLSNESKISKIGFDACSPCGDLLNASRGLQEVLDCSESLREEKVDQYGFSLASFACSAKYDAALQQCVAKTELLVKQASCLHTDVITYTDASMREVREKALGKLNLKEPATEADEQILEILEAGIGDLSVRMNELKTVTSLMLTEMQTHQSSQNGCSAAADTCAKDSMPNSIPTLTSDVASTAACRSSSTTSSEQFKLSCLS